MRFSVPGIGHYELVTLPGSPQVAVSCRAYIEKEFRGQGWGTQLAEERLKKARDLGYDYIIATVRADNAAQVKIMKNLGWEPLDSFTSRQTDQEIIVFGKKL